MKRRDSRKVSKWNWVDESIEGRALGEVNGFMELSNHGESIELEEGQNLRINWEREVPLFLDEEGYFDTTEKKTLKGSATVKKVINVGQDFLILAAEGDKDVQFLLKRSFMELI
ncbi:hypothetical protein IK110_03420 [Candidatus Saccharibacteria bacterium]|nr:hypothetical protein [Candidatus Saccharibacteria bacterium]